MKLQVFTGRHGSRQALPTARGDDGNGIFGEEIHQAEGPDWNQPAFGPTVAAMSRQGPLVLSEHCGRQYVFEVSIAEWIGAYAGRAPKGIDCGVCGEPIDLGIDRARARSALAASWAEWRRLRWPLIRAPIERIAGGLVGAALAAMAGAVAGIVVHAAYLDGSIEQIGWAAGIGALASFVAWLLASRVYRWRARRQLEREAAVHALTGGRLLG